MSSENFQTVYTILFYAGIVLSVIGLACLAGAAYMYFARNIRDIQDDISGKKRAEAIASMLEPGTGLLRARSRSSKAQRAAQKLAAEATTGSAFLTKNEQQDDETARDMPQADATARPVAAVVADDAPTTVMVPDDPATTIIGTEGAPNAAPEENAPTTILVPEDPVTALLSDEVPAGSPVAEEVPAEELAEAPVEAPAEPATPEAQPVQDEAPQLQSFVPAVRLPEFFLVVNKVVLTGSDDFLRVGQGEGHA